MLGHFRLWPPSRTDCHTWPKSHASIDPMPGEMKSDSVKLLYCAFQQHEVMTMSVVRGQPKKHTSLSYKARKHIECTYLFSYYY